MTAEQRIRSCLPGASRIAPCKTASLQALDGLHPTRGVSLFEDRGRSVHQGRAIILSESQRSVAAIRDSEETQPSLLIVFMNSETS